MKKKVLITIACVIFLAVCGGLIYGIFYWYHATKKPTVVADLCYGKYGRTGTDSLVYVKENDQYIPYIVIDTKNYGDDAVLLLRKFVYMQDMMYRDENMFGAGGAYYNGCIVDNFLELEFYNFYSDGMKAIIRNAPVKIHSIYLVSKRRTEGPLLETINRHVFVLSAAECGGSLPRDPAEDEGELIPEVLENSVSLYTWLRSEQIGGDDTHASLLYRKAVVGNHIQSGPEHYVRPVITVNRNEPIELRTFDTDTIQGTIYVFPGDE